MGIFRISITLLLAPLLVAVALFRLIPTPQSIKAVRRPGKGRGRLVLFGADETSLQAVKWALRELVTVEDFVHFLHIVEFDEQKSTGRVKGLMDCCKALASVEIPFDGEVRVRTATDRTEDMILRVIQEVSPDVVLLGSSKRTGEQDIGAIATNVALRSPVTVTLPGFEQDEIIYGAMMARGGRYDIIYIAGRSTEFSFINQAENILS